MNIIRKKLKALQISNKGFTLLEMVVALAIFAGLMSVIGVVFVQILNFQRRGLGAQRVQENSLFIFELMSREIRVSRIENQDSLGCTATTLTLDHPVNGAVVYTYDSVNRKVTRTQGGATADLSGSNVLVNRFNFCIMGSSPTDNQQVRVSIVSQIQPKGLSVANTVIFDMQTGVTSRDVTTEYQN